MALQETSDDVIEAVVKLVEKIRVNPTERKYRRLKTGSAVFRSRFPSTVLLEALGFTREADLLVLSDAACEALDISKFRALVDERNLNGDDLAKALAMSTEEDDEDDLAKALAMSTEQQPTVEDDKTMFQRFFAAAVARGLAPNAAAAQAIEHLAKEKKMKKEEQKDAPNEEEAFERMDTVENVSETDMSVINLLYQEDGVVFVDPSFPPAPGSLYNDPQDATRWTCSGCGSKNPLSGDAMSREGILRVIQAQRQGRMEHVSCRRCGTQHPLLEVGLRPSTWVRPNDLRDDLTQQTSSVPWVVFRSEPRADDLRQGGVGNCWFVCALSLVADKAPELLKKLFLTTVYNPAGAYQIKLNLGGHWHVVTVDDSFPVNALENAAYLKPARRSLWCPLVEKAAAKLHGSYEALNGGTFAEAFSMLTGFPVKRLRLGQYQRHPMKFFADPSSTTTTQRQEEDEESDETGTKRTFDERYPDGEEEAAMDFFAKLYSLQESGFLVGACTFVQGNDALEAEMRSLGLQTRHAYGVLDVVQFQGEPLVKLRNPNGVALWKGPWSRSDTERWTAEAVAFLKPQNDDQGVFWLRVEDLVNYFAELTVCRLLPDRVEARSSGWLASAFGPGQAIAVEAYARTALDIAVYQEPHKNRGVQSSTTAIDLGLALVKLPVNSDQQHPRVVASAKRQVDRAGATCDATLELDAYASRYLVVPLCFGHVGSQEPRKFLAALHSASPLAIDTVPLDSAIQARAVVDLALKFGKKIRQRSF